jgi:predicted ester cyclase
VCDKEIMLSEPDLSAIYRSYLDCLNRRDWPLLGQFVDEHVVHNGRPFGLAGYRAMLEQDVSDIPDVRFDIELLVTDAHFVASRLRFDCTPAVSFLGLDTAGKRIAFAENVFYRFRDGKIVEVWSLIDRSAIEAQI